MVSIWDTYCSLLITFSATIGMIPLFFLAYSIGTLNRSVNWIYSFVCSIYANACRLHRGDSSFRYKSTRFVWLPFFIHFIWSVYMSGFAMMVWKLVFIQSITHNLPESNNLYRNHHQPIRESHCPQGSWMEIREYILVTPWPSLTVIQYLVYCAWLLFEIVYVFLFLVETKGMHQASLCSFNC